VSDEALAQSDLADFADQFCVICEICGKENTEK
jgi:hypothetical protein